MPYANICDTLHGDPRALRAGHAALGLHLLATSYSAAYLTEGAIPEPWVSNQGADALEEAETLIAVGLWARADGGFQIPDWLENNISNEKWADIKAKKAAAGKKGGEAKALAKASALAPARADARSGAVANLYPEPEPEPEQEPEPDPDVRRGKNGAVHA